jgi:NAD(P)-dependent dehydrogenase (short-subunit alcohol dehydrogenase family)
MTLVGQVALVTGAGRGIGRQIALDLAAAGASVILVARTADEIDRVAAEITAAGGNARADAADILDAASIAACVERVGDIDLLLNNAGAFAGFGPVWDVDPTDWWRDIEVNLRGTFNACRAALGPMRARGYGRIVNMVGGGTALPFPNGSGYGTSKAGLMRMTESLDAELAGSGVLAFAMDPGLVRTSMTERQLDTDTGRRWLPQIATMFETGVNLPPTRAAALSVAIASGRLDRLHGRLLRAHDDPDATEAAIDEILAEDRMVLRIRGL